MAKKVASVPRVQFYAAGRVANPASRANEAAAEASVSFFVPFNLCGVSTNATPTTSVENTFVFESFLPGGTVVEGARTYSATANAGTLDIFEHD